MPEPKHLERCLLGIPELDLRIAWLRAEIGAAPATSSAPVLDALAGDSEAGDLAAREALLAFALLAVADPDGPTITALREVATAERLLHLERVLRRGSQQPAVTPSERPPVPDYGAGRELSLGERRSLARKPTRRSFEKLLLDPHPLVIHQLLANPRMTENDLIRIVTKRPARIAALREVARAPRWLTRERVRMSLLLNPGAPTELTVPLLCVCTRTQLHEIKEAADVPFVLRATAGELLERRPPMQEGEPTALQ